MNKKSISSLELAALVNELQILAKGKVSQIYHQDKKELLLQLHALGKGKKLLKIIPGKYLCLTTEKNPPLRPTSFCMQLRKYINNSFIKAVYQKDAERIVVFELEKEENYYLIFELFSKGNIILAKDNYEIITSLQRQIWKDRVVKAKEEYIFPTPGCNWQKLKDKELLEILQKSDKKNLATSLATEVGLGGLYAEEVCKKIDLDKNKLPNEVNEKEAKSIVEVIKVFLVNVEKPKGYLYEEQITPFPLLEREIKKELETYNAAIDTLNPFQVISPYEQKIKSFEKRIKNQQGAILSQQKKIEDNKKKGETIYENYAPIQKMLDIVKELRKEKTWQEVAEELKKEKKIRTVNLKNKKVVLEL